MAQSKSTLPNESKSRPPIESPLRSALCWAGWLMIVMAVIGICAAANSLFWQLQTRLKYQAGECRVVNAKIIESGQGYELFVEHQVVIGDKTFRATRNTDQNSPAYNNLADAEAALKHFAVGSLHPCWYDAEDPNRHSVLTWHDMDTGMQSLVLGVSLLLGILGLRLVLAGPSKKSRQSET